MSSEGKRYIYPLEQFARDYKIIGAWAEPQGFLNVYGILRGGIVPATFISYYLDIPLLCSSEVDRISRNTLVVEDLIDTGDTLILLEGRLGFIPTSVALFVSREAKRKPTFAVNEKRDWIQFPWETSATSKYDGTFRKFLEAHPKP